MSPEGKSSIRIIRTTIQVYCLILYLKLPITGILSYFISQTTNHRYIVLSYISNYQSQVYCLILYLKLPITGILSYLISQTTNHTGPWSNYQSHWSLVKLPITLVLGQTTGVCIPMGPYMNDLACLYFLYIYIVDKEVNIISKVNLMGMQTPVVKLPIWISYSMTTPRLFIPM